jgi:N-acetylmuramoyl-L-alanine amidase
LKIRRVLPLLLLLAGAGLACARLSPLAPKPNWSQLDKYQGSITRADFLYLLDTVYAPGGVWKPFIKVGPTSAEIQTRLGAAPYVLQFAPTAESVKLAPRFWRQKAQMAARPENRPLAGVRIALDPGHLGGSWAKMEERWFQIGKSKPVTEGDMTLYVAKLLVPRLTALGAQVFLTRTKAGPVTPERPKSLGKAAVASLADKEQPVTRDAVAKETELLFYRVSEIRHRAELINEQIRPDLVVCLHFNAEPWGDEKHPTLTDRNHLHLLVTGAFGARELIYDDQRFDMLRKLLSRAYREELGVSEAVAASMARATGLPPYLYTSGNAIRVGSSPYVWARNLLANRLYDCPVVYVEPYVMNSRAVFARIQEGDYAGKRAVDGRMQRSIYREYADGIAQGLVDYYSRTP